MTASLPRRLLAALALVGLLAAACSDDRSVDDALGNGNEDPGDCVAVDLAVSPEKATLLTELARDFNGSEQARVGDQCVFARVQSKSSGGAAQLLTDGWDEAAEGPRPVIWSPAASSWGAVLNQRLSDRGQPGLTGEFTSFMLTPLVIAMPRPMAQALGWPDEPLGFGDILGLARDQQGWAGRGHPEWGAFRLGKTNPNFSTSGLSALMAQAYAANGKTSGLSIEDLAKPSTAEFASGVESAVVHYGDTTLTFMNNWFRADQRGNPFGYVSAVAVEEKSVIDYNRGDPDGVRQEGEEPRPPRVPLVAIYPEEGTLYSDNPLYVLDAEWVDDAEQRGAAEFVEFVQEPANQRKVLDFGFRPGNPEVAVGTPIDGRNGVDADQPQTLLEVPQPAVLAQLLDDWEDQRKSARVLLVIDVSGSMGDLADPETGATKLDLAKSATVAALDDFNEDDEVGLWIFSTDLEGGAEHVALAPPARVGDVRESLKNRVRDLVPLNGTPLYRATQAAYEDLRASFDPSRINAVVLLSDGVNDDGEPDDDRDQLEELLEVLASASEGQQSQAVRVFPISYGESADLGTLRRIAEASQAAVYDSSDPRSINKVFVAVVSNF
ncbi:MAG: substrate-binding domain-containing protein [Acidimicrobiales bacterium]|nr:substrate-binding domain-containing protein [Acidimicrobiales bacterium]